MTYEQEQQRATHLLILLVGTVMIFVLTAESVLMGWDKGAVVLLLAGLVLCWGVYVTEKMPDNMRLFSYFILTMAACFFYGIHETSIFDLAPLMIFIMILFSFTERYRLIQICVAVYLLTMMYDFVFVLGTSVEFTSLEISRIFFHFLLVCLSSYMTKIGIRRRREEREKTWERIEGLEEANRRTEDFLANVSHELRTPINAVTGITSVMLKNEENEGKRRDLHSIQTAGQRLYCQISDILDYSELDNGKIKVSEDRYMISSLINDVIAETRMKGAEHHLEMIFDVDASIPAVLLGDEKKIKKILGHLIDNACKFTREGGIYVRVFALQKEYGINLCIRVRDTGIGIESKEQERICESFYQSNAGRDRKAGGLGLGLSIVYGMVSAMEGFIKLESVPKEGTTVSVSIPQKVADAEQGMAIRDKKPLCIGCYLCPEFCDYPAVRDYYNEAITHMVQGLEMPLHRVFHIEELTKLTSTYKLTHLFIGDQEYLENGDYFEHMDPEIQIIAIVREDIEIPPKSRVIFLRKPFYTLSLVNILNSQLQEENFDEDKYLICPGIRVLVVDDEPMNLMVAEGIFKEYQMQVTTAESGPKALALCENNEFDLIFLDHMMPEMDGVETLKHLRKIYEETGRIPTVIAFTANAVSGAREMFLREGFDEFISKPIEPVEMERLLRKVLPNSSFHYVDKDEPKVTEETTQICMSDSEDQIHILEEHGIHTVSGLQYCSGDLDFYTEVLTKFVKDSREKSDKIRSSYQEEDWKNYTVFVHALKSTAKMVGADELSEQAREMEAAAKHQDIDYIRKNHEKLLAQYDGCVGDIKNALKLEDDKPTRHQECETEVSAEELLQKLTALKDCLDTFEADQAEELLEEVKNASCAGTSVFDLLSEVRRDVEDFEFASASEKLEKIMEQVEGGED